MSLGYTAAVHRRAAKAARKQFFAQVRVANTAAQRGACKKAVTALAEAAAWHGVAAAEWLDSGPKKGRLNFGPTSKPIAAAKKNVLKRCSCTRK